MSENGPNFVEWREQFISQERGSRVVHYYLEDSSGESYLAVVGTERSLRHMLYVVSEEFCQVYGSEKSGMSCLKWRSRREVVDWLTSFLPKRICSQDHSKSPRKDSAHVLGDGMAVNGLIDPESYLCKHTDRLGMNLKGHNSDIVWSGVSWVCGKQLRHYHAFCRNGTTISTHSFVLVMSEEEEHRYLAYLEDMYEDKKGQKKVKVRWFHQNQEVACAIPPPNPHPREVFITPYSQVISAECVDDLATVLTPTHYERCLAILPYASSAGIHLCFRQYSKNRFKPFDLSTLRGYFDQAVLSCLDVCTVSGEGEEEFGHGSTIRHGTKRIGGVKGRQRFSTDRLGIRISVRASHLTACRPAYQNFRYESPVRRPLSVKFIGPRHWLALPFKVNEKIELLCQDSGIRGCWFRCTVLQLSQKRLKVRYDDVQNEDGCGNLEEWIPAFRPAAPDKLGMRCSGRLTIRPCLPCNSLPDGVVFRIGTPVDAWWSDGWWEGVVIGVDSCGDDDLQIYFPGEDVFLTCQRNNLRISKDWVDNRWVDIDIMPNILSAIFVVSPGAKLSAGTAFVKGAESGSSAMSDREAIAAKAVTIGQDKQPVASLSEGTDELLEPMKQDSLKKEYMKHENLRKRPRDEGTDGEGDGEGDGDGDGEGS